MEVVAILGVLLIGFIIYKMANSDGATSGASSQELTEADKEKYALQRQKFDALKNDMKKMTTSEIAKAVGTSERSIKVRMIREQVSCADFDGEGYRERVDAAGGSEKYLEAVRKDTGDTIRYGVINKALICPHCQTKGQVRSSIGPSQAMLTTSNTYKAKSSTKMHCDVCGTDWMV